MDEPGPSRTGFAAGIVSMIVTGDAQRLDGALALAAKLAGIYFEQGKPLPRGAAGIDWYESQMGPGFLLHGMARTALLAKDRDGCELGPDYTGR